MAEEVTKKSFVFIIQLEVKAFTTARILNILMERSIEVDELHFYGGDMNRGRLMIHCRMLRDRISRTATLMSRLPGVIRMDWMESRRRDLNNS
jgi:ribulose kinase